MSSESGDVKTAQTNETAEVNGTAAAGEGGGEKTERQLKKEAKNQAKLEKFKAKQAANQQKKQPTGEQESKKKKEKEGVAAQSVTYSAATEAGEFKDMSQWPDSYSPRYVEAQWYSWWEKQGMFTPEYDGGAEAMYKEENKPCENTFMIVIPPPNVTGSLHIGHGLTISIEDTLVRWHRMCGRRTLWVPGCDHAGIATQVVVEKKLKREQNLSRHDIGREAFVENVWKWKKEKGHIIYDQIRAMGASVDWNRTAFTMDEKLCRAVVEAFVRLHDEKLIYRDNRLVNWSCTLKSAISEMEVDKKELTGRTMLPVPGYKDKVEFGVLVSFAYPVVSLDDQSGETTGVEEIIVSTTRIETMLADAAVAVHPDDERYKSMHGKFVRHPIRGDKMPIIADDFVDMSFGTGAVKITPAHDHNDFTVGKKHQLPFYQMMDEEGNIQLVDENEKPMECKYNGMKRFIARKVIAKDLDAMGLFKGTSDNAMVVPVCSRSKDIIEPLLKPQWYVDCDQMAADAIKAVVEGNIKLFPVASVKQWNSWLERIRPWCISRQLWWGHQIPAYYVTFTNPEKMPASLDKDIKDDPERWISARSEEEAIERACKKFNVESADIKLTQDEDVLDTWFSSGLFPFSVLGWPEESEELKRFYPGALLETGNDIMFFWVARMVFMGQKLMGDVPFKEVFFHALVRDAHGRKISKSLGNVVDPVDVIHGISLAELQEQLKNNSNLDPSELHKAAEGQRKDFPNGIPECGTDALRFALCAYTAQGRDVNLDVLRVQGYRFFCNKIWNATKLAVELLKVPDSGEMFTPPDTLEALLELASSGSDQLTRWILSRLAFAVEQCNLGLSTYTFPTATTGAYQFFLYELCDKYLEHVKPILRSSSSDAKEATSCRAALYLCLDTSLRLMAPFMPFITEELWQRLPRIGTSSSEQKQTSIHVSQYPQNPQFEKLRSAACEESEDSAFSIIRQIRGTRANYEVSKQLKLDVHLSEVSDEKKQCVIEFSDFITTLSGCKLTLLESSDVEVPKGCAVCVLPFCKVNIVLADIIDKDKELGKLANKKETKSTSLSKLQEQTKMPDYETKVPETIRLKNTEKIQELEKELTDLEGAIEALNAMQL